MAYQVIQKGGLMAGQVIVFITADSKKTSAAIIKFILDKRLAACVNEMPGVISRYWWKGAIVTSRETLLMVKTKRSLVKKIIYEIKKIHPYEVPEIISVAIKEGSADYLKWIDKESTGKK
jgi:periplasmic divalent cation tolerance protein